VDDAAQEIIEAFEVIAAHTRDGKTLKQLAAVVGEILLPHCVVLEVDLDEDEDWDDILDVGSDI
jgi:hypothetical protein